MPIGWRHSYWGVLRKSAERRLSRSHWDHSRSVARTFELPDLPRKQRQADEVWAIFLVKNEADVLGHTLKHAFGQGIDRALVVDNGSTDGTLELINELTGRYDIIVGFDHEAAYYQSHKMTYLARWASKRGAGWVIPTDADEFWFAESDTVGDFLRSTTNDIVEAQLFNLFPTPAQPEAHGLEGTLRFDHTKHVLGKTALRGHPLAWLSMGNHFGVRPGMTGGGLFVAHVPWRSRAQYGRKVRQGAAALASTDLEEHLGGHWRRLGDSDDAHLDENWSALLDGVPDGRDGWNPVGPFSMVRASAWKHWPHDLRTES